MELKRINSTDFIQGLSIINNYSYAKIEKLLEANIRNYFTNKGILIAKDKKELFNQINRLGEKNFN